MKVVHIIWRIPVKEVKINSLSCLNLIGNVVLLLVHRVIEQF